MARFIDRILDIIVKATKDDTWAQAQEDIKEAKSKLLRKATLDEVNELDYAMLLEHTLLLEAAYLIGLADGQWVGIKH